MGRICGLILGLSVWLAPVQAGAGTVDFSTSTLGTKLTTQFPGVDFGAGGIVKAQPSGNVASFSDLGCEFCASNARIAFSAVQRLVSVHAGLVPVPSMTVTRNVRLSALDVSGSVVASDTATLTAGSGFATLLMVATPTPSIAVVRLEAMNDVDFAAEIAISDLTFEDTVPGAGPDFSLEVPPGWSLLEGAAPADLPITIKRFGGSTGAVNLSVGALPAMVTGSFNPSSPGGASAVFQLSSANPANTVSVITITGTPATTSVGSAPRTASVIVTTSPRVSIQGPADLDFSSCLASSTTGTLTASYWVVRDFRTPPPLHVELTTLSGSLTGSVMPTDLDFAGGASAGRLTVTLQTIPGPIVPDTWVWLHVTGSGADRTFPVLVHGTCPQAQGNFVMRGRVRFIDRGLDYDLAGAEVEINRHRSNWYDDRYYVTHTDDMGFYRADVKTNVDGDYYARIRLTDHQVHVTEALNSMVWSVDTPHVSNKRGLIDNGEYVIERDGGSGIPLAAVWQAFRRDIDEFINMKALPYVPGGFLAVNDYMGHSTPITFYDDVDWGHDCVPTASTHEFGHVVRHTLDGDRNHWNIEASSYAYGRGHEHCTQDVNANDHFGFNEGWADYYAGYSSCECTRDTTNQNIGGTVAYSLKQLELGWPATSPFVCPKVTKMDMIHVLAENPYVIHSDLEFRDKYKATFANCKDLPPMDRGCAATPPGTGCSVSRDPSASVSSRDHQPFADQAALDKALARLNAGIGVLVKRADAAKGLQGILLRASVEQARLSLAMLTRQAERKDTELTFAARHYEEELARYELRVRRKAIERKALEKAKAVAGPLLPEVERRLAILERSTIEDPYYERPFAVPDADDNRLVRPPRRDRTWPLFVIVLAGLATTAVFLYRLVRTTRAAERR